MSIGRFQVMAVLQAARAHVLGLGLEEAKSWGLNRAIFYAAAKRGYFREKRKPVRVAKLEEIVAKPIERERDMFFLGDEGAFFVETSDGIRFKIGGKVQRPRDFDNQVASRFYPVFEEIWEEALKIVSEHPKETLLSQRKFYKEVYEPLRDVLVDRWRKRVSEARARRS